MHKPTRNDRYDVPRIFCVNGHANHRGANHSCLRRYRHTGSRFAEPSIASGLWFSFLHPAKGCSASSNACSGIVQWMGVGSVLHAKTTVKIPLLVLVLLACEQQAPEQQCPPCPSVDNRPPITTVTLASEVDGELGPTYVLPPRQTVSLQSPPPWDCTARYQPPDSVPDLASMSYLERVDLRCEYKRNGRLSREITGWNRLGSRYIHNNRERGFRFWTSWVRQGDEP